VNDAYTALVAGDSQVATACEPLPGGVRLRLPELPQVWDYNAAVLAPGADASGLAEDPELSRIIAFSPATGLPDWPCEPVTVMAFDGPAPAWPEGVSRAEAALLRDARRAAFGSDAVDELLALADRQAAVGSLAAVLRNGRPLAWSQVMQGVINDVFCVPEARGRGLGRAVTVAAMAAGGRWLMVDDDNAPAIGLYRSLGFEAVGTVLQLTRRR
jgi:GNAT superfamily N-acetyltransferase